MTITFGKIIAAMGIATMILGGITGCKDYSSTIGKGVGTIAPYAGEPTPLPKATKTPSPAKTLPKSTKSVPKAITEDDPGFDCRTQGNHICGPHAPGGHEAGCYRGGHLIIAWSNYSSPRKDPLWGQVHSPCSMPKASKKVPGATIAGICRHPAITRDMLADCNKLASRPAEKGAGYSNPQGRVLVKECTDQYRGEELAICLR